jgi:uncharacterized protein (DUF2267 family)
MTTRITWSQLLQRVMDHGLPDHEIAVHAIRVTLHLLGQRLTDDEALSLAAALAPKLERIVDASEYDRQLDGPELYARATQALGASSGRAHEAVDVVVRELGTLVPSDLRRRLYHALPYGLADLLMSAQLGAPAEYPPRGHAEPSTLASGRPGSRHPLSEAIPVPAWPGASRPRS